MHRILFASPYALGLIKAIALTTTIFSNMIVNLS